MVAYNFQTRFAEAVASGQKRQTIRAPRKDDRHAKPGDKLQLYTGMRTKSCRKLRDAVCHDSCAILLEWDKAWTFGPQELFVGEDLERFAQSDGFACWADMRAWFEKVHGLPFTGQMIRWLVPLNPDAPKEAAA
ncbi:hypothetical protein T8A63_10815 [Sulfitobacter sp. OXR-159]|uniref:hypothetical protein n=1 Tax=Sulfitobacter sp. OXR-159 TaxID=3100174 RepID=UPI002AC895CE|nr:hypothetical protein [Sulfitobacter sp. OXR-159]WPZ28151.1 hypothetical protein T8A63_10815 [Sulfitobacter sp. OXR-159]